MPATFGLHIVRKRVKSGERHYVYAFRGGPCIHIQDGPRPAITPEILARAFEERKHQGDPEALDRVIDAYRESPAFAKLRPSTQADYRTWLNRISDKFGQVPMRFFNGEKIKPEIYAWRDDLAETPRAADRAVGMLATLLSWAMERGIVKQNAAAGIKHLHKVNRADLVWELRHWKAVEKVPRQVHRVLVLASLTGLRQSDLLALQWEQIGPDYIATTTQKTGGEAVIPMHAELQRFLWGPGKGAVLRNSLAEPWTVSGFKSSWQKAKPAGFDRTFHDLRGTFATRLVMAGFTDAETADVMGWTAERVASIRLRYVDRNRVTKALAERLRK